MVWATGYRRRYPWLQVPVLDGRGNIAHRGGFTAAPGLYVLGMQFLRRNSNSSTPLARMRGCNRLTG